MHHDDHSPRIQELLRQHYVSEHSDPGEISEETLAAYVEGRLSDEEIESCEAILAKGGQPYHEFLALSTWWLDTHDANDDTRLLSTTIPLSNSSNQPVEVVTRSTRHPTHLMVAASVALLLLGSGAIKLYSDRSRLTQQIALLHRDALEQRFVIAEISADQVMQQAGYPYWIGDGSGIVADWDRPRSRNLSNTTTPQQRLATVKLSQLATEPNLTVEGWLRLAGLQTKAGELSAAENSLKFASPLSSTATYRNTQACLLIAQSLTLPMNDSQLEQIQQRATDQLEQLIANSPQPESLFNLANLYLTRAQHSKQLGEQKSHWLARSIELWDEFLSTNADPILKSVAQQKLSDSLRLQGELQ